MFFVRLKKTIIEKNLRKIKLTTQLNSLKEHLLIVISKVHTFLPNWYWALLVSVSN